MTVLNYDRMANVFEQLAQLIMDETDMDRRLEIITVFHDWLTQARRRTEQTIALEEMCMSYDMNYLNN